MKTKYTVLALLTCMLGFTANAQSLSFGNYDDIDIYDTSNQHL